VATVGAGKVRSVTARLLWWLGASVTLNLIGAAAHLFAVTTGERPWLSSAALILQGIAAIFLVVFITAWWRSRRRGRTSTGDARR
jgi:membrane protein YdbS with pleckstrin-like domain